MYETILAENERLLTRTVWQYARICQVDPAISMEDLFQTAFLGLARAADTYDPAAGKSWPAWAAWKMRGELAHFLGLKDGYLSKPHIGAVPLNRQVPTEDGLTEALIDLLPDESLPDADDALMQAELRRGLSAALERLESEPQRQVARLRCLEGRSYPDIARRLGISVGQARRLWQRACARLCRDRGLRRLAGLDERTRFHAHKGVAAFNRDWTSVTEAAALWRIKQRERA